MRTLINGVYGVIAAICCPVFTLSASCQKLAIGDEYEVAYALDAEYPFDSMYSHERDSIAAAVFTATSRYGDSAWPEGSKKMYTSLRFFEIRSALSGAEFKTPYFNGDAHTRMHSATGVRPRMLMAYAEPHIFNLSIPLDYTLHRFNFYLVPGYDVPVNANEILRKARMAASATEASAFSDRLNNVFAFTLGIRYPL